MNEETPSQTSATAAPGGGAGDAASTQAIPRLNKTTKKAAAKSTAPAKKVVAEKVDTEKVDTERESSKPEVKRSVEPHGAPAGRPLTAADYARTTKPSPSTTAVIPAVKDEPQMSDVPAAVTASSRQASLRLNHVEPWSVTRIAFAISVAMMIVWVVATTIFWAVLSFTGVWGQVNDGINGVLSNDASAFDITQYLGFWRLIGLTLVLSAINVILVTALATIGAHLYNLAAQLLGGIEVTFVEEK